MNRDGSRSTADPLATQRQVEQALQRQTRLVAQLGRGAAVFGQELLKGIAALDQRLAGQSSKLGKIGSAVGLGLQRAAETSERGFARVTSRVSLGFQRAAEAAERANVRAAANAERAWGRVALAAGRGVGQFSNAAGSVIGSAGQQIGGALSGLSLSPGGLVRSAGSLAGVGIQGAANLGGAALGQVPLVGGLLKGGVQALGGIAGGVAQLGANLGGQLVDAALGAVKVGLVAGLGVAVAGAVRAAKGEQLRAAFEGITASIGTDATSALGRFREATRGLVSDLDLIQSFNQAVQLRAVATAEEFATLSDAAIQLGKAVGRDAVDSINDLVIGLGRQSPRILDNLGIIVSAETAYQKFAASVGKTSDELTDAERRQAFTAESLERIREAAGRLGTPVETVAEKFQRFQATLGNLLEKVGQPLLGILGDLIPEFTRVAESAGKFLDENKVRIAENIKEALDGVVTSVRAAIDYLQDRGLAGAFEDAQRAATSLWDQFKKYALAAIEFISGEIKALVIGVKAEFVEVFKFDFLEGFGTLRSGEIGNTTKERRQIATEEEQAIARNIAKNRAGIRLAGFNPDDLSSFNVAGPSSTNAPDDTAMRQFIATSTRLFSDRSNRALMDRAFGAPPGLSGNPLESDIRAASNRAALDPEDFAKLFSAEALKNLTVEQSRNIQEALDEEGKRLAAERLATEVNRDKLDALKRTTDYEKRVREDQQSALREYNRLAEEESRIREGIVENVARIALVIEETSTKVFDAFMRTQNEAARAQEALIGQFRSAMDSAGGDPALPRNLRLGLQRGERLREREIKNRLRDQFGNLSAGEIAGNVDLQAQVEAGIVATRIAVERPIRKARDRAAEEAAPGALAPEFQEILDKAKADFDAAREELLEVEKAAIKAIEEESAALVESLGSVETFMERATEAYEENTAKLGELKNRTDELTAKIASVERATRSLK